ncbi:MAG: FeoA domain-containing protein [Clostridiales bacterium]|nr:FeoA domain-containing protein [Clostridiales bacterium]
MTLDEGKIGHEYLVQSAVLPLQVEKRMEALGMTQGTKIKLMRKKGKGTSVILLRGTRFAVGCGITSKITVMEASNE